MPLTPISEIIKNAAPNVRTIENGYLETHNFYIDNNTNCTQKQALIASILPHGAENAVPAEDLCNIMGYSDTRQLRYEVHGSGNGAHSFFLQQGKAGATFCPLTVNKGKKKCSGFVHIGYLTSVQL